MQSQEEESGPLNCMNELDIIHLMLHKYLVWNVGGRSFHALYSTGG